MANPYTSVSATNYNASPPPDDGSTTASNEITWAGIKTKLADPLHSEADTINTNVLAAFAKMFGATISAISSNYTVVAGDQGKLLACTNTITITLPDAGTILAPFCVAVKNVGTGTVTIDPLNAVTIDGKTTISLAPNGWAICMTDGSVYRTLGSGIGQTLSANTTFYVATTGNDSTGDGSSGAPWATIQHAYNTLQTSYNLNGFTATISVADGPYTAGLSASSKIPGQVSPAAVQIVGNSGTPANCIINLGATASAYGFFAQYGAAYQINGFDITGSGTTQIAVCALNQGYVGLQNVIFSALSGGAGCDHIVAANNAVVQALGAYTINGGADIHMLSQYASTVAVNGVSVGLSGTPAFSTAFAQAQITGTIAAYSVTYTGSATGTRYVAATNGVIITAGGGASYFPGNSAGSTSTGGQYG